jgi:NAD(P)-dependent dehydrogenase (short-subunit alcohol dehydrogenase family)
MEELRFDGRVIAITGAAHGMGQEHAVLLAQRGAKLLINDIAGAADTVDRLLAIGAEAIEDRGDITDPVQTDAMVRRAVEKWGRLDAIINNAAAYGGTLVDPETTDKVIAVHLIGTINMIRSVMPVFRQQRYGRILNVCSGSIFGLPGVGTYAAGKGGVFGFTRSLARELALETGCNIKANMILPVASSPRMPRVPDAAFQAMLDKAFSCANVSPTAALLVHERCPAQGEAIHVGGGRQARVMLATTAGWQCPDDAPSPESILDHWQDVVANLDPRESEGSMADLLGRRGIHPYSVIELVKWAQTGVDPAAAQAGGN